MSTIFHADGRMVITPPRDLPEGAPSSIGEAFVLRATSQGYPRDSLYRGYAVVQHPEMMSLRDKPLAALIKWDDRTAQVYSTGSTARRFGRLNTGGVMYVADWVSLEVALTAFEQLSTPVGPHGGPRPGAGRKAKSAQDRRTSRIQMRVTEDEYTRISEAAEDVGMRAADWLREAAEEKIRRQTAH